jgi:DUF438 domain-containing protein
MENIHRNAKTWALAGLFKRINLGENPKLLRNEASQLAKNVGPDDIAQAKQTLIDEGYSSRVVNQLSAAFMLMGLYKRENDNSVGRLPDDHILRKIMVEHDLARCFLADLNNVTKSILNFNCLTDVSSEFRKFAHIVRHLAIMKEHIDREQDAIFPFLTKHGWKDLCQVAQDDHSKIRLDINNLVELVIFFNKLQFVDFKIMLISFVQRLSQTVLEHISYENELLYPLALVVIDDVKVWEEIKALCEDIGYCGAHG